MCTTNGNLDNILNIIMGGIAGGGGGECPCGCQSKAPLHEQALVDAMDEAVKTLSQARDQAEAALSRFLATCEKHEKTVAYYETVRTNKDLSKFFGNDLQDASHILEDVRAYTASRGMVLPIVTVTETGEGYCQPAPLPAKPAAAAKPAAKPAPAAAVKRVVVTSPAKKKK
jgi:hypothetical protein